MSDQQTAAEVTKDSAENPEMEDNTLFVRNLIIAMCLVLLGLFVAIISVLTVLIAGNINVLEWLE